MASAAENRRGILFMLTAMSLFVGNDVLMKLAREAYPVGQAIALRTVFATLVGFAFVLALRETGKLPLALRAPVLLRGVLEAATALSYVWALGQLPIAEVTAIGLTSPLLIVLIAVALRIERVGWRRAVALMVGFCGVLVVLRPSPGGVGAPALVALASAVLVACRDLLTRRIGDEVPATVISLATTLIVGIIALSFSPIETWVPLHGRQTLYLAVAAVLVALGSLFIVGAYRHTDVGVVSGYRYTVIVFAVAFGYFIWGHVPDATAFAGMALIVGSGLYTMHRQRVRPDSKLKIPMEPTR